MCEKEYEQIVRTPFVIRQVKLALCKTPLRVLFYLFFKEKISLYKLRHMVYNKKEETPYQEQPRDRPRDVAAAVF